MAQGHYVSYLRVSTDRQGKSGLGLEAQRATVCARLNGAEWKILAEFVEVETGTRKRARPELQRALAHSRIMQASLIVANVSRLTRDPDFMGTLVSAGVEVEFCDLPKVEGPIGTFVLRQMLAVAELEAGMISDRTKKALAAAKARGTKLGGDRGNLKDVQRAGHEAGLATRRERSARRAHDLIQVFDEIRTSGYTSLGQIARELNRRGIRTVRGGLWSAVQVQRLLLKLKNGDVQRHCQ